VSKIYNCNNLIKAHLNEQTSVATNIPKDNHAALRAGFSGLPINPRWNINKFRAWQKGRQLREALAQGQMTVRSTDSMLVSATEQTQLKEQSNQSSIKSFSLKFGIGRKKEKTLSQAVNV
jgi:hypothetical protein